VTEPNPNRRTQQNRPNGIVHRPINTHEPHSRENPLCTGMPSTIRNSPRVDPVDGGHIRTPTEPGSRRPGPSSKRTQRRLTVSRARVVVCARCVHRSSEVDPGRVSTSTPPRVRVAAAGEFIVAEKPTSPRLVMGSSRHRFPCILARRGGAVGSVFKFSATHPVRRDEPGPERRGQSAMTAGRTP
jgi:hypothetical protein